MASRRERPQRRVQEPNRFGNLIPSAEVIYTHINGIERNIIAVEQLMQADVHYTQVGVRYDDALATHVRVNTQADAYLAHYDDPGLQDTLHRTLLKLQRLERRVTDYIQAQQQSIAAQEQEVIIREDEDDRMSQVSDAASSVAASQASKVDSLQHQLEDLDYEQKRKVLLRDLAQAKMEEQQQTDTRQRTPRTAPAYKVKTEPNQRPSKFTSAPPPRLQEPQNTSSTSSDEEEDENHNDKLSQASYRTYDDLFNPGIRVPRVLPHQVRTPTPANLSLTNDTIKYQDDEFYTPPNELLARNPSVHEQLSLKNRHYGHGKENMFNVQQPVYTNLHGMGGMDQGENLNGRNIEQYRRGREPPLYNELYNQRHQNFDNLAIVPRQQADPYYNHNGYGRRQENFNNHHEMGQHAQNTQRPLRDQYDGQEATNFVQLDRRRPIPRPRTSIVSAPVDAFSVDRLPPASTQNQSAPTEQPPSDTTSQKTARLLYLSTCQPTRFDGKPREFPAFDARVGALLGDGLLSGYECVDMLPKFVEGEPLKVIKNMQGRTYKTIMERLRERYGHPTLVANDYIRDLVSGSQLQANDRKGLLTYADLVVTAADALTGQYLVTASCQPNMEKMVNRLPGYLQNEWEKRVGTICADKPAPELQDLAKFVERAAKIKNNPFYHSRQDQRSNANQDQRSNNIRQDQRSSYRSDQRPRSQNSVQRSSGGGAIPSLKTDVAPKSTQSDQRQFPKKKSPPPSCDICQKDHNTWLCTILRSAKGPAKESLIREHRLCVVCFNKGCRHMTCPRRDDRFVCKACPIRHHKSLLCRNPKSDSGKPVLQVDRTEVESSKTSGAENYDNEQDGEDGVISSHARVDSVPTTTKFMLGLMPINVNGPNGKTISTYAFIDSGSKASFIDEGLAAKLGITGPRQHRFIKTIVGRRRQNMKKVSFDVSNIKTGEKVLVDWESYILLNTDLSKMISDDSALSDSLNVRNYEHLAKLDIPVPEDRRVGILLGLPVRQAHEVIQYHDGGEDKPYGIETKLGISIAGPIPESNSPTSGVQVLATVVDSSPQFDDNIVNPPLDLKSDAMLELLERLWKFEDYGTENNPLNTLSPQNRRALDIFTKTLVQKEDLHYESGLTWAKDEFEIPYNRHMALSRLVALLKRLKKDPVLAALYCKSMSEYIDNDWAEEVPEDEIDLQNGKVLYLIYFLVFNPNKPGKARAVFHAAAEYKGVSLNSLLIGGPDASCSLIGVLLRARFAKFCAASDVKAMFNQCYVRKEDRDALRFLWVNEKGEIKDYRMKVHIFGAADSPYCANKILKQIGIDNKAEYAPEVVAAVEDNFYVDDSLVTAGTQEKLVALTTGLKSLLAKGGMNLTKFTSNSKEVLRAFDKNDRAKPELDLDLDPLPTERALGLQWNVETDCFGYKITKFETKDSLRGMTSQVARTFDPIGGVAPAMLTPKRLIQDCWRRKLSWDEPLPDDLLKSWKLWQNDFHLLENISIPRPYFPAIPDCRDGFKLRLHLLSDSCDYATGLAAYLRGEGPNGEIHLGFVVGKSKLLPLHPVLFEPKGELKAAVDLVRLGITLESELRLKLEQTVYWTDSELVLKYINNDTKTFKPYVANRRSEIREKSQVSQWRHVPGILNTADPASRGVKTKDYTSDHPYLQGPQFLRLPEDCWPKSVVGELANDDSQIKKAKIVVCHHVALDTENTVSKLIHDKSTTLAMKKPIAWCFRFKNNCTAAIAASTQEADAKKADAKKVDVKKADLKKSDAKKIDVKKAHAKKPQAKKPYTRSDAKNASVTQSPTIYPVPLTVGELEKAECAIIAHVQREYWPEEIACLVSKKPLHMSSRILNLNPYIDANDGLLRVGGRLSQAASLHYEVQHPIILPRPNECRLSATMIVNHHTSMMHGGAEMILAKLRERYWIMHAKSYVRLVVSKCILCKRRNAQPMSQLMSDLPPDRLSIHEPCFTNTGTDCLGPIICKDGRRRDARHYGVLFVCLNTKAVHLELVKNLDTNDFVNSLLRFIALRNNVKTIRSDNGSNYVGAERELRELIEKWNKNQVLVAMRAKGIHWTFQPPLASSMSGIWERKVKETKRHLYATLRTQTPDPDTLRTLLYEVASIMNSSPLCPVSNDPTSLDVLTPAHFLFQRPVSTILNVPTDSSDNYNRRKWRQMQFLADCYWTRYVKDYIPCLQQRKKWLKKERNLRINDLVLMTDSVLPRSRWLYGRVIEVFPGRDDLVRTVRVKTKDSQYIRPIQRLALISASDD